MSIHVKMIMIGDDDDDLVVALVRGMRPDFTPAQVRGWITRASTKSTITSVPPGTPNALAYVSCV